MLQMRARSFALRDAFPDVLKGLISVEEVLDNHAGAGPLPPLTIDATAEPTAPSALPPASPRVYRLTTKQGTTTFPTAAEWLATWAKLIDAVAAFDPEPAATLTAQLDQALEPAGEPS
jgi:hypothetical protein